MLTNHPYIASPHNMRVKQWASLLEKKYRDRIGQFIVEGVHLVLEALKAGAAVSVVVYDVDRGIPKELLPFVPTTKHAVQATQAATPEWVQASAAAIAKCTGTDTAPPVFAIVGKLQTHTAALYKQDSLVILLDGIRDPGNAGTIIRSADAAGADAVILGRGCVDLYNPKTVRSTMGSLFHLPIIEADLFTLLQEAKQHRMNVIGTSLAATNTCYSYNWTNPTWLLMGSESEGLSPELQQMTNESLIIPMAGDSESLNVAMASTILLFEAMRQRKFN
ncbi:TrmH family RNA methyltransferase [Paenibacillus yanchengensis]|uniref:TrmH family RNA methyltransferase n=1 Tax=Paenibacillus yanchengensis TaxID=2035833 RepID=A0ABW4YG79_9BACL